MSHRVTGARRAASLLLAVAALGGAGAYAWQRAAERTDRGERALHATSTRDASSPNASRLERELRATYGAHADAALGAGGSVASTPTGFSLRSGGEDESTREDGTDLRVDLPVRAGEPMRFTLPGGAATTVRESSVRGEASRVGRAVSYAREGGRAYWSQRRGGVEEWLDLEAGLAHAGRELARWTIEGLTPRLHEGEVLLVDADDVPQMIVRADEAFTARGRRVVPSLGVDGAAITLEVDAGGEAVLVDPSWTTVGNLVTASSDFVLETAVRLGNNRILLAHSQSTNDPGTSQLYDPATNTWSSASPMSIARQRHVVTPLPNGNALACTGLTFNTTEIASCEIYNQTTNTWSAAAAYPGGARVRASGILMGNGRVLLVGGINGGVVQSTAHSYDPVTNTWAAAGTLTTARYVTRLVNLSNGNVAAIGGTGVAGAVATIEIYNPTTNAWTAGATMSVARSRHAAVRLGNGAILVAGGTNGSSAFHNSAELCNATATSCTATGSMASVRQNFHGASYLSGTKVLVAGGVLDGLGTNTLSATELYDVATGTWSAGPAMSTTRRLYAMATLADGKILVAGGTNASGTILATSELFSSASCGDGNVDPGEQCDDGNTASNDCCSSSCQFESAATVCRASTGACDVADTCNGSGTCNSDAKAVNGTSCSDANACTQTDTCQAGVCVGANPITCTASDACHVAGTCNPGTGVCSNPNAPNGTSCSDANACTQTDSCQAGTCVGSNPVTCTASDACHVAGTCNPGTGVCSNPNAPNGTSCNDANACTQTDSCQAGACVGSNPVTCTASDQCHVAGTCNPGTGICSNPNAPNGTNCNDGNACTQTDSCQAGVCFGDAPIVCGAIDQCHGAGTCNPSSGICSNPNLPNGSFCNDGNACTQSDSCQSGTCTGASPVVCAASDQCHDVGTCNPGTGVCSNPVKADGSTCNDGNGCTQTDACTGGACVGNDPVVCAASDQCHDVGTCNPGTGLCSNPEKIDGASCDDGNACTQTDACTAGACQGQDPVVCAASDQCHDAGTCDALTGLCSNPEKIDGASCDDGNACTQTDACTAGACQGQDPVVCAASDQCHDAGTCDALTGLCSNPEKIDGASCDVAATAI